ncbi:MAG: hypothetical protein U0736_11255 [Gemmataceae bacterium]
MTVNRMASMTSLAVIVGLMACAAPGQEGREAPPPVRRPKAVLAEAVAAARASDKPARTVHVEVVCVELAGKAGEGVRPLDRASWTGPAREVRTRIRDLQQKGLVVSVKTMELTGLTGHATQTKVGESRPMVTGLSLGGGGFGGRGGPGGTTTTRSIMYRDVGMTVMVRPEAGADGQLTLELNVMESHLRPAEGGVTLGADDKGTTTPATEIINTSLESRLKVRSGQFVLAQSAAIETKAGPAQRVILVTATTEDPETTPSRR